MALEEEFDIELPDEETTKLKNLQDVADLISGPAQTDLESPSPRDHRHEIRLEKSCPRMAFSAL